jgi:hypothetical protein
MQLSLELSDERGGSRVGSFYPLCNDGRPSFSAVRDNSGRNSAAHSESIASPRKLSSTLPQSYHHLRASLHAYGNGFACRIGQIGALSLRWKRSAVNLSHGSNTNPKPSSRYSAFRHIHRSRHRRSKAHLTDAGSPWRIHPLMRSLSDLAIRAP